jgi:UDP-galactopyranose mutase
LDFSWLYIPGEKFKCHRIINTGSFSENNTPSSMVGSCVVEFSGAFEKDEILSTISSLPFKLRPISSNFESCSYIIHDKFTNEIVSSTRGILERNNIYLLGRAAEWEYYNMDKAMEASFRLFDYFMNEERV